MPLSLEIGRDREKGEKKKKSRSSLLNHCQEKKRVVDVICDEFFLSRSVRRIVMYMYTITCIKSTSRILS